MRKILMIGLICIMLVGSYLLGTTQAKTKIIEIVPNGYSDSNSEVFQENYVDMREVEYFEVKDGLQLYMKDGSGYYWN